MLLASEWLVTGSSHAGICLALNMPFLEGDVLAEALRSTAF